VLTTGPYFSDVNLVNDFETYFLRLILVLFSLILPSMPRSSIHLPHSGNRNTALHSFVFSPMRATRPSHPNHSENKISLSPRGLSKLHLSLLSELHEISVEAITGLYFHHLKIVNSSDFGFLICDAVLSGVHTSAKIYVVLHLTNTWQKHSPSRDREVPHF